MALKTNYRDALYDGSRRYRLIQNEDGTYNLPDATTYTQEGDKFGANDINTTNEAVNRINGGKTISLPVAGWSAAAPYTQTISVSGMTVEDIPVIGILIADSTTATNVRLQNKAWGCVDRAVTGDGTITFFCYNKKPATDFSVLVKGV